jgi:hypothetical protein
MWWFNSKRNRSGGAVSGKSVSTDDYKKEGYTYYYSRGERLNKLKTLEGRKRKPRFFSNKKRRNLLILLIDLFLIAVVMYFLNKPANIYLQKNENGLVYELNVTGIKGKKILIGISIKNQGVEKLVFSDSIPIVINIEDRNGEVITLRGTIKYDTILFPEESTSIVFLLGQDELPGSGKVIVFTGTASDPIFSKDVRF